MADLPNPPLISANDTYEVVTDPGRQYLLTLKGVWDSGEITLDAWNQGLATWASVDGGPYTTDTELRLVAPSGKLRIALSGVGANTAISVTLIPFLP